jgi:hypothetical protein
MRETAARRLRADPCAIRFRCPGPAETGGIRMRARPPRPAAESGSARAESPSRTGPPPSAGHPPAASAAAPASCAASRPGGRHRRSMPPPPGCGRDGNGSGTPAAAKRAPFPGGQGRAQLVRLLAAAPRDRSTARAGEFKPVGIGRTARRAGGCVGIDERVRHSRHRLPCSVFHRFLRAHPRPANAIIAGIPGQARQTQKPIDATFRMVQHSSTKAADGGAAWNER